MQIFLLIVIFILIAINLKQADELRDLERKNFDDSQSRAASGRYSERDKQEKAQSDVNGSKQRDNAFDREP